MTNACGTITLHRPTTGQCAIYEHSDGSQLVADLTDPAYPAIRQQWFSQFKPWTPVLAGKGQLGFAGEFAHAQ
jgi:hypothetical protein